MERGFGSCFLFLYDYAGGRKEAKSPPWTIPYITMKLTNAFATTLPFLKSTARYHNQRGYDDAIRVMI
jgi:hypothetical protein